jgi:hypothetical protein
MSRSTVSDQDFPTSGSRWEPATGNLTPADDTAAPADDVPPTPPRRLPGRRAVAAAGVGLVLAGGVGGFAIGHAVTGTAASDGTVTDQNGVPNGGAGGRPDFRDGDRPGPGNTPPDTGGDGGTA